MKPFFLIENNIKRKENLTQNKSKSQNVMADEKINFIQHIVS